MYCHECGAETADGQTFCRECGAELVYQSSDSEGTGGSDDSEVADHGEALPGADTKSPDASGQSQPDQESGPEADSAFDVSGLFEVSSTDDEGTAAMQSRELATNAMFGYGFLVLLRVLGISDLLFLFAGSSGLVDAALFLFYR